MKLIGVSLMIALLCVLAMPVCGWLAVMATTTEDCLAALCGLWMIALSYAWNLYYICHRFNRLIAHDRQSMKSLSMWG